METKLNGYNNPVDQSKQYYDRYDLNTSSLPLKPGDYIMRHITNTDNIYAVLSVSVTKDGRFKLDAIAGNPVFVEINSINEEHFKVKNWIYFSFEMFKAIRPEWYEKLMSRKSKGDK